MIPQSARAFPTPGIVHDTSRKARQNPRITHETPALLSAIPEGRLTELEGAATTALARLVLEVQREEEPAAWVLDEGSTLHPPDLAAAGVDLAQLTFLRVGGRVPNRLRAAELVLRSGGFGLVVVETVAPQVPVRALARLHALCRRHSARVVFRRPKHDEGTLGPLIGLKLFVHLRGKALRFEVLKDKTGGVEMPSFVVRYPPGCDSVDPPRTAAPVVRLRVPAEAGRSEANGVGETESRALPERRAGAASAPQK